MSRCRHAYNTMRQSSVMVPEPVEGTLGGYMYILRCADGSYYTGSTRHLGTRLQAHQQGEGANHTKERLPVELIYAEAFDHVAQAFYREKQIQGWTRSKKEARIRGDYHLLPLLARNYTQYPPAESTTEAVPSAGSGTIVDTIPLATKSSNRVPEQSPKRCFEPSRVKVPEPVAGTPHPPLPWITHSAGNSASKTLKRATSPL